MALFSLAPDSPSSHRRENEAVTGKSTASEENLPKLPESAALGNLRSIKWLPLSGQIMLAIFPILFIALAATSICLDKQPISQTGKITQAVITISPTIFPIIFAAIIGKFLRALGLFWAERGINLGTLERLVGSQSFFSAVERQFLLPGQYVFGISMIILWGLSPLGGQSALRILAISPRLSTTNSLAYYMSTFAMANNNLFTRHPFNWPLYGPQYLTALTTSTRDNGASTQDLFGNIKIPSLDYSVPVQDPVQNNSWITIDYSQDIIYSSLLGIPMAGIPENGNLSFSIMSRYFATTCQSSKTLQEDKEWGRKYSNTGWTFDIQMLNYSYSMLVVKRIAPFNITSMNTVAQDSYLSFAECSIEPQDVESIVDCTNQSCKVTRMRRVEFFTPSWTSDMVVFLPTFLMGLPAAATNAPASSGTKSCSSMTEMFIAKPFAKYSCDGYANLDKIPLPTLSKNLGLVLNTYWQAGIGNVLLTGNLSTNITEFKQGSSYMHNIFSISEFTNIAVIGEQYSCNMTFAALLIVTSGLLLLAAGASITLSSMTLAPDILGYVSSLARENPFAGDSHPSYLDGLEKANAMKNQKVAIGDVNAGRDIGYIAFASAARVQTLEKDRSYS